MAAFVGNAALANTNASVGSVAVTRTLTAGNLAVAVCQALRSTTFTITGVTAGWTLYTASQLGATLFGQLGFAWIPNVAGGSTTCTFTLSSTASTFGNTGMMEFSAIKTSSPLDGTPVSNAEINTASGTDCSAGPITTADANGLLVGAAGVRSSTDTNVTWGSPASWTNVYRQNNSPTPGTGPAIDAGYWLPGAAQTNYTAQWSNDNNAGDEGAAILVGFLDASFSAPTVTYPELERGNRGISRGSSLGIARSIVSLPRRLTLMARDLSYLTRTPAHV